MFYFDGWKTFVYLRVSSNFTEHQIIYEFEVIKVKWHHNRGDFIFARHLGVKHDFDVPDGSLFGGIPVYNYLEMRPIIEEGGDPCSDIFVFRPVSLKWLAKNHFAEGQQIKLTINNIQLT